MNRCLVKIRDLHVRLLHKVKNVYAADGHDLFFMMFPTFNQNDSELLVIQVTEPMG